MPSTGNPNQFAAVGLTPDVIIGCTGGGSNFAGRAFPFLRENLAGRIDPTIRAVEPASCPSLTKGVYAYDFGDTASMTGRLSQWTADPPDDPATPSRPARLVCRLQ